MSEKAVKIYADIRHPDDNNTRIMDALGNVPSTEYREEDETWEGTLGRLGREVVGRFISVDKRLFDNEITTHDIVYLTDQLDNANIEIAEGWHWGPVKDQHNQAHAA